MDIRNWTIIFFTAITLLASGCAGLLEGDDDTGDDDTADDDAEDDDAADDDAADDDTAMPDDDAADDDAADDDVADDDAADDDVGDDDTASVEIDDNTCDEGATANTQIHFMLYDTSVQPIEGAVLDFYDLDAAAGVVDNTLIHTATTDAGGNYTVSLDCAHGWVAMDVTHPDFITQHIYFRVLQSIYWPLVSVQESLADIVVGWYISDQQEGVLAVYKASTLGAADFQAADTATVDGSPNLIPSTATNDFGMWIYDDAQSIVAQLGNVHFVDHDVPEDGDPALLEYTDSSEAHTTAVYAPVWSWDSGSGNHNVTVVYVVD